MADYKVYRHSIFGYEPVKQGFSWPGFFFTWIWAFIKKLYVQGVILLVVGLLANAAAFGIVDGGWRFDPGRDKFLLGLILLPTLLFLPGVVAGLWGNRWREKSMMQRGFKIVETVNAGTADAALAKITE